MIELNKWFIVQLINFLALLIILNIILFEPLLKLFRQRKENIEGAIEEAKRLNEKKDNELEYYNKELTEAREKAKEVYNMLRQQGLEQQKEMIIKAQQEASKEIEKAKEKIRQETEKSKEELREYVKSFSTEIMKKLLIESNN